MKTTDTNTSLPTHQHKITKITSSSYIITDYSITFFNNFFLFKLYDGFLLNLKENRRVVQAKNKATLKSVTVY